MKISDDLILGYLAGAYLVGISIIVALLLLGYH